MERFNQEQGKVLSKTGSRDTWSERIDSATLMYNRTPHSTTGFAPCIVLYSFLCTELDEVPEEYRDLLAKELRKYRDWKSMRVFVQGTALVPFIMISRFS